MRRKRLECVFGSVVNVGDVMVKEGDIFGDGVNVAARLEGLINGGEICVSRGVRDHLRHRGGLVFEDLGEQLAISRTRSERFGSLSMRVISGQRN
jgi:class 3 adenylate cyclase